MKKEPFWIMFVFMILAPGSLRAENAADYIAKGNKLASIKQYAEALAQYQKAAKLDSKSSKIPLLMSLCYARSGDLDQALTHAQLASKSPSYIASYNLGLIHSARKESDQAIEAFDRALEFDPKSFNAEYQKGLVYASLEKYDQAISFYQTALQLNPSLDKARIALFGAFLKRGDRNAASLQIKEFRRMKKDMIARALEERLRNPAAAS